MVSGLATRPVSLREGSAVVCRARLNTVQWMTGTQSVTTCGFRLEGGTGGGELQDSDAQEGHVGS